MTWSVATPTCVVPFSIISRIECSTPATAPKGLGFALLEAAPAVELAKQLVGAVDEVDGERAHGALR
jgi:hypothetical protein